ncbi:MAG: TonB family protein [bacterium]
MKSTRPWTLVLSCLLTLGLFSAFFRLMPCRASGQIISPIAIRIRTAPSFHPAQNKIRSVRSLPKKLPLYRGGRRMGGGEERPFFLRRVFSLKKKQPVKKNKGDVRGLIPRILTARSSNELLNFRPAPGDSGENSVPLPVAGGPSSAYSSGGEGGSGGSGEGTGPGEGEAVFLPPSSASPAPGDTAAFLVAFQSMVSGKLNRAKIYPIEARERREEGTVILSFLVEPDGHPSTPCAVSSSGYASLDQAAVAAVASASPFLPFPEGFPSGIRVKARVRFYLSNL